MGLKRLVSCDFVICFWFYRTLNFHHLTFFFHRQASKICISLQQKKVPLQICHLQFHTLSISVFSSPQAIAMIQQVSNTGVSSLRVWLSLFRSDFICVLPLLGLTLKFPLFFTVFSELSSWWVLELGQLALEVYFLLTCKLKL